EKHLTEYEVVGAEDVGSIGNLFCLCRTAEAIHLSVGTVPRYLPSRECLTSQKGIVVGGSKVKLLGMSLE
ncbi:hypothetical protein BaRGS_00038912, partial [Batillaria attramentaria]